MEGATSEDVARSEAEIINGTSTTASGTPWVLIETGAGGEYGYCSGVAIRNDWVLTASHCILEFFIMDPSQLTIRYSDTGSDVATADWIVRGSTFDIALIHLDTPLVINGSNSGYEMTAYAGSTASLVGSDVEAFGYGPSVCNGTGGSLLTATLPVVDAWDSAGRRVSTSALEGTPDKIRIGAGTGGERPIPGDSGSPIAIQGSGGYELVGIMNRGGCSSNATYVSVNGFWTWALTEMQRYETGSSLAAGDFNGDGSIDVALGRAMSGIEGGGRVTIHSWASGSLQLTQTLQQGGGFANEAGDRFGAALAVADFNNDGYDDLAIGSPGEDWTSSAWNSGAVHVFRGSSTGLVFSTALDQASPETREGADHFGMSLTVGDFDGDGVVAELAVGAPHDLTNPNPSTNPTCFGPMSGCRQSGAVFVFACSGTTGITCTQQWIVTQATVGDAERVVDEFGYALAAGDFDGEGRDDLAVGAPGDTFFWSSMDRGTGSVFVFEFSGSGVTGTKVAQPGSIEEGDRFGFALAAGQLLGGTEDDLVVGAPGEAPWGGAVRSGWVYALQGSSTGLTSAGGFGQGAYTDERDDFFGAALYVGQLTLSSSEEVAVGAPHESTIPRSVGRVCLAEFDGTGLSVYDALDQDDAAASGHETGDQYGAAVGGFYGPRQAGLGWDGHLLVGVRGEQNGTGAPRAGAAHFSVPSSSVNRDLAWIWGP